MEGEFVNDPMHNLLYIHGAAFVFWLEENATFFMVLKL